MLKQQVSAAQNTQFLQLVASAAHTQGAYPGPSSANSARLLQCTATSSSFPKHPPPWRFCTSVPLVKHVLVNSFPQHPRGQISSKFHQCNFSAIQGAKVMLYQQGVVLSPGGRREKTLPWLLYFSPRGNGCCYSCSL